MTKRLIYKSEEGKKELQGYYNKLLLDWNVPNKKMWVNTSFGKTFILVSGPSNANPVVLLHGSGSNSAMWSGDVKKYAKNYRTYAIDILGECGNSDENRLTFRKANHAKWLREIFQYLEIERPILIACSLGGWIALDFATTHPLKVNKMILLATGGISQVKFRTIFWIMITSFLGDFGFRKLNKMVYGSIEMDKQTLEFSTLIRKHYLPRTDPLPLFSDRDLKRIKCPVLFIGGENDCFYHSNQTAKRLNKLLDTVQTKVLDNIGHVLMDQSGSILDFLND